MFVCLLELFDFIFGYSGISEGFVLSFLGILVIAIIVAVFAVPVIIASIGGLLGLHQFNMRIIHAQFVMIDRIGRVDFLDEYSKEGRLGIVEGGDHLKGGEEGGVGQQAER